MSKVLSIVYLITSFDFSFIVLHTECCFALLKMFLSREYFFIPTLYQNCAFLFSFDFIVFDRNWEITCLYCRWNFQSNWFLFKDTCWASSVSYTDTGRKLTVQRDQRRTLNHCISCLLVALEYSEGSITTFQVNNCNFCMAISLRLSPRAT